jgi:hypothetical protein
MIGRPMLVLAVILGALMLANGLYMLVDPDVWYAGVPGVAERGSFNQHFVRDIGLSYLLIGSAFLIGAARPAPRLVCWLWATLWLSGHALFHVWETLVGITDGHALLQDVGGVLLPALAGAALCVSAARGQTKEAVLNRSL